MAYQAPVMNPNGDIAVSQPPDDCISSLSWSPTHNILVAGSWNKQVRCWDVQPNGQSAPRAMIQHAAPVLCTAFSNDGERVFSGSCDKTVKMWQLQTNQQMQVAQHDAPVKHCFWISQNNLLVTGSWDRTLRYWDIRGPKEALKVQLPERVYAMDCTQPLVTVATANRGLLIFNLAQPDKPYRSYESPLKFQSRCIANFIDRSGFALGSIEGRVAVQHVEEKSRKNFAFKCHRHSDEVYAVNSISFHPMGTFATCGSDGGYTFWDKDSKQRLKLFKRAENSITCSGFNRDGSMFAYGLSYDWSKGIQMYDKTKPNKIMLHGVKQEEIAPRRK